MSFSKESDNRWVIMSSDTIARKQQRVTGVVYLLLSLLSLSHFSSLLSFFPKLVLAWELNVFYFYVFLNDAFYCHAYNF